ncbi:YfjI family protein, partial [Acidobacteria bacterium AH-259-G07]|nr:YfjI family protein [Acidobacteria bacterium AH-259-G07]
EEALKKAQTKAAKAKPEERAELIEEAIELSRELSELNVSVRPRYIADDCSPERLASLLSEQAGRIALMSPEGDVFDLMAGRYSANQAPNLGVYLKGHSGDDLRVDRVGRPPEYVPKPALTIGLTVQPEVVRCLAEKPGFRARGLLARFLYSIPKSLLGLRRINPPPVSASIRKRYHRNVQALLSLEYATDSEGKPAPHVLRLDEASHKRIQEFQVWLEPQLSELGTLGTMTDWAGKLVGQVCRIAGILHVAEFVQLPAPWKVRVRQQTIERAIQIGKYLIPHAQAAFSLMGSDQTVANAEFILRWIKNKDVRTFSKRELHQSTRRGRFSEIKDLEAALDLLVDHGFVCEQIRKEVTGPGRKKSPEYEVNPHFFARSESNSDNDEVPGDSEDIKDIEEKAEITKKDIIPQESKATEGEVKLSASPQNPQNPQNSKNPTVSTPQPKREIFKL